MHNIGMIYDTNRLRLFVDGKTVADQQVKSIERQVVPGGLGIGRLVEGGLSCGGPIEWLRILPITPPTSTDLDQQ